MGVQIAVQGDKDVAEHLNRAAAKIENTEGAIRATLTMYFQFVQKNFQTQGGQHDDGSLAWKPLAKSTLEWKRAHGYSALALIRTGTLRQNWGFAYTKGSGQMYSYSGPRAAAHEFGTNRLPQRKMLPNEAQATKIALGVFQQFASDAIQ